MIVVDSNIWVSFINSLDSCHEEAKEIMQNINPVEIELSEHVYCEVLTVLRNKASDTAARNFMGFLQIFNISFCQEDEKTHSFANEYFFKHNKLSYIDALLLAKSTIHKMPLLTFDQNLQKAWKKLKK